jgi:hypothetical protein
MVLNFSGCRVEEKNIKIMFFSMKHFLRLFRKPHQNFCSGVIICHWSIFSSIRRSLDAGKIRQDVLVIGGVRSYFLGSKVAFVTIVRSIASRSENLNKLPEEGPSKDFQNR